MQLATDTAGQLRSVIQPMIQINIYLSIRGEVFFYHNPASPIFAAL